MALNAKTIQPFNQCNLNLNKFISYSEKYKACCVF